MIDLLEPTIDLLEPTIDLLELLGDLVAETMELVADTLERLAEDVELRVQIFEHDHERRVAARGLRGSLLSGGHSFSSH